MRDLFIGTPLDADGGYSAKRVGAFFDGGKADLGYGVGLEEEVGNGCEGNGVVGCIPGHMEGKAEACLLVPVLEAIVVHATSGVRRGVVAVLGVHGAEFGTVWWAAREGARAPVIASPNRYAPGDVCVIHVEGVVGLWLADVDAAGVAGGKPKPGGGERGDETCDRAQDECGAQDEDDVTGADGATAGTGFGRR